MYAIYHIKPGQGTVKEGTLLEVVEETQVYKSLVKNAESIIGRGKFSQLSHRQMAETNDSSNQIVAVIAEEEDTEIV